MGLGGNPHWWDCPDGIGLIMSYTVPSFKQKAVFSRLFPLALASVSLIAESTRKGACVMIAALIIAAGKTAQKAQFEPQKEIGTIPALLRIVKIFQRADVERVVVVGSENGDGLEKLAPRMNVVFLHHADGADMLEYVKAGLAYLKDKCTAALISHVGVPLFTVDTVRALVAADEPVCIPSHRGSAGHPLLLRSAFFDCVLSYNGSGGLSGAVKASGLERAYVEVDDEGVLANTRREKDYARLLSKHSLAQIYPEIRIRLAKEKAFYGPGAHQLLKLTDETSSLSEACRQMGISYSKGRKIIFIMEQQLGQPVIVGRSGGKYGGFSVVTEDGKKLMRCYVAFHEEAKLCVDRLFSKHFAQ